MIPVSQAVKSLLYEDYEALYCFSHNLLNLTHYATHIHNKVATFCRKDVQHNTIVMALSRLQRSKSYLQEKASFALVPHANGITIHTPVTQKVFERTPTLLKKIHSLEKDLSVASSDNWHLLSQTRNTITITGIAHLCGCFEKHLQSKPLRETSQLTAFALSEDVSTQDDTGIFFQLCRPFAFKGISIVDIMSQPHEVIMLFHNSDKEQALGILSTFVK